jgi:hypothetical protein
MIQAMYKKQKVSNSILLNAVESSLDRASLELTDFSVITHIKSSNLVKAIQCLDSIGLDLISFY